MAPDHFLVYVSSGKYILEEEKKNIIDRPGECVFIRRDSRLYGTQPVDVQKGFQEDQSTIAGEMADTEKASSGTRETTGNGQNGIGCVRRSRIQKPVTLLQRLQKAIRSSSEQLNQINEHLYSFIIHPCP